MNKPLSFEEWADTKAKTNLFSQMANDYADYYFNFMIENKQAEPKQDEWHYLDWKPNEGEGFYFIYSDGVITNTNYIPEKSSHIFFLKTGNVYKTHEQAKYHLRMIDLAHEVKRLSFKPDWNNEGQRKYFLTYGYSSEKIFTDWYTEWQNAKTYFETEEIAKQAIKLFENDADFLYCFNRGLI